WSKRRCARIEATRSEWRDDRYAFALPLFGALALASLASIILAYISNSFSSRSVSLRKRGLVVARMGFAEIVGHRLRIVEIGDCRRKMRLSCEQDVLSASGEVGFVPLRERRDGESIPPKRI